MTFNHLFLAAGWLIYCGLHSLLANDTVKSKVTGQLRLSMTNYRLFYNVFALASLVAMLYYQFTIESVRLFQNYLLRGWVAPGVIIIGLTGMVMCIIKYFRQLSGIKEIQTNTEPVLETTGMHRYVRHPLYIATFVFLIGLFLYMPFLSNLIAVVIIIAYTLFAIRFEEEKLIAEFGDQYVEYKRKVPMLIPFGKKGRNADNADLADRL